MDGLHGLAVDQGWASTSKKCLIVIYVYSKAKCSSILNQMYLSVSKKKGNYDLQERTFQAQAAEIRSCSLRFANCSWFFLRFTANPQSLVRWAKNTNAAPTKCLISQLVIACFCQSSCSTVDCVYVDIYAYTAHLYGLAVVMLRIMIACCNFAKQFWEAASRL